MLWKILRYTALTVTGIIGAIVILILSSIAPVDRTPARELDTYGSTFELIANLDTSTSKSAEGFAIGVGKTNITPPHPVSTAGYGKRKGKPYVTVHDSIFVRSMVISNGTQKVAIVSADLLIIPPMVTRILPEKLAQIGFSLDNTYLTATHSHNSIGHWGEGATRFIYGAYDDSIVHFLADGIVASIARANDDLIPGVLKSGAVAIPDAVENRLIDDGVEDPWLRILEAHRADSSRAVLVSYAAHATCLSTGTLELSRDYPGLVVDKLEGNGFDFAMFAAGGVGSHRGSAPGNDWACMEWMADALTDALISNPDTLQPVNDGDLLMRRVPFDPGDPQVKISRNWKLRSWLFRAAFGKYDAFLTVLRVGDVVMLGTPCDFSGEFNASLDSVASTVNKRAMITSFNGGYIGYLTPEKYYDIDHYETQLMNWYAPGTGEYVNECLKRLLLAVSHSSDEAVI